MSASGLPVLVVYVVGWCLVHFLWQAALVGGLYALARPLLPRGNARYLAAMLALAVLAALPVATAVHLANELAHPVSLGRVLVAGGAAAFGGVPAAQGGVATSWHAALGLALPWLVLGWACGVMLIGARTARHWWRLRAIVRAARALPRWQARAQALGQRLGLVHPARILASVTIVTPTLVGWVRPAVVLPLAMLARMPAEQMDLVIAHELAHLRRLDHWANLFQVVLETLLFYHPVVHWISRDARNERELCCDAVALRITGGRRRDFVAALAGLEEFRLDRAGVALAASGGVLAERAWFIAGAPRPAQRSRVRALASLCGAMLVVTVLAVGWWQARTDRIVDEVLAGNAAWLQQHAAVWRDDTAFVPAAAYHVALTRPSLTPLGMARVAPPREAPDIDRRMRVRIAPATIAVPVAPAVRPTPITATGIAPAPLRSTIIPARPPTVVHSVAPAYPVNALLAGVQGRVAIEFTVDAGGVPHDLRVLASGPNGVFDAAALQALSQWRFAPTAATGQVFEQTFTFQLGAGGGTDATIANGCFVSTGTHLCRRVPDAETVTRLSSRRR